MFRSLLLILPFLVAVSAARSQNVPAHPAEVIQGRFIGVSQPLRDLPKMTADEFHQLQLKGQKRTLNKGLKNRSYPYQATALPKGADPVWQNFMGSRTGNRNPELNIEGQQSPYYPPDCNGVAGPGFFMQTINCVYAIYNKTGGIVAGPTNLNLLFGSVPGANRNDGDPIILYDEAADRWVVTEFSIPFSGPNYVLMAVSVTNDPTGSWYQYSFQVASMPDYPKFSVWRDGYYMGDNNTGGNDIYVFEREKMLIGAPAQAVGFNNAWRPNSVDGFMCVPPIDNDGALAPAGTPGMFIAFNDDAIGGGSDQLWLYELAVNWTTPTSSTFIRSQQIDVQPFNCNFGNNWDNIEQKGTSQRVDGVPQVIMNVPQYRNFGSYQTIVCCHTVNTDGVRHAGIRWYELRKTTGNWEVRQQGTYAPDVHSRWMGSVMLNGHNEIAMGYSVSSTTMNPSIFYCAQSPGEYANASGIMDIAEDTIVLGTNSQTGINRWGDYAQLCVDPADDKTFWFTSQYGGNQKTKIASFRYQFAPDVTTQPATAITYSTATLHGTVNPNGMAADYHFEYGHTPMSLTQSTPSAQLPAGSTPVEVSADVTGLLSDTVYYCRLVATTTGGTAAGLKVKFNTPAAPFLAVTPDNRSVTAPTGTTWFLVQSNTDWSVSSDATWCRIESASAGNGTDTIRVSYDENISVSGRIANISVSGTGVPGQGVTVTQEGAAPLLSVTPPAHNVSTSPGSVEFQVSSNTDWSVTSDAAWCTVTPSGSLNGIITATYQENTVLAARTCNVTVTVSGLVPVTVTVTQEAVAPMLSVTPANQNVTAQAGSTFFTLTSNTLWTVNTAASWCTFTNGGSGNGSIVVDYSENTADQPRIATFEVTVAGLAPQTVTVTQARSSIGIGENNGSGVQIYPNPTHGEFRVTSASNDPIRAVTVKDATGKIIFGKMLKETSEEVINLGSVAAGAYNITVTTRNAQVTEKLVVIR